jgi:hypothetical protein
LGGAWPAAWGAVAIKPRGAVQNPQCKRMPFDAVGLESGSMQHALQVPEGAPTRYRLRAPGTSQSCVCVRVCVWGRHGAMQISAEQHTPAQRAAQQLHSLPNGPELQMREIAAVKRRSATWAEWPESSWAFSAQSLRADRGCFGHRGTRPTSAAPTTKGVTAQGAWKNMRRPLFIFFQGRLGAPDVGSGWGRRHGPRCCRNSFPTAFAGLLRSSTAFYKLGTSYEVVSHIFRVCLGG